MTNEEKAKELSKKFARQYHANNWPEWSDDESFHYSNEEINNACIEMAQWKDEQFKEQKKLIWKEVKYIIELDGNIETDNFIGSDEYYQAIADKANVVLFGLQGKLDD